MKKSTFALLCGTLLTSACVEQNVLVRPESYTGNVIVLNDKQFRVETDKTNFDIDIARVSNVYCETGFDNGKIILKKMNITLSETSQEQLKNDAEKSTLINFDNVYLPNFGN